MGEAKRRRANPHRYSDGTPKLKPQMCVECGLLFNASSPTQGKRSLPKPGNVSLCLNCGHLALFGDDMMLREPTAAEWTEPELQEIARRGRAAAMRPYEKPDYDGVGMKAGRA
jgi:hypothetical protein